MVAGVTLTGGEGLPEEVSAAGFTCPVGEADVSSHQPLPVSQLVLFQLAEHLFCSGRHQFRQEQE